ncbi:hypothetical protein ACIBU0_14580, partial [Streptomyces sp. NPDC049627]
MAVTSHRTSTARAMGAVRAHRHDRRWLRPRRALEEWLGGKPDGAWHHRRPLLTPRRMAVTSHRTSTARAMG